MKYIKQLDSLRAIAVILVIISHWIPANNLINITPNGAIGVDIFFVLSGYLISKILFDNREDAERLNISKTALLKNFYVRRTLRIFPIYYLTIFLLLFFSNGTGTDIRSPFLYLVTYTSNFYFFKNQTWDGMISHLWSLAVEEQFYLIWPWIIVFAKKKYLLPIISAFVVLGIVTQLMMRGIKMSGILTFSCFDAFGLGAILSWVTTYAKDKLHKFYLIVSPFAVIAVILLVLNTISQGWSFLPLRTMVSIIALWLITYIVINNESGSIKFKFILDNRVLIFLGKISYGLYLYHNIIPTTLNSKLINKYLNPLLPDILYKKYWGQLFLFENIILLVTISWLSYILIEKRFLYLKRYFSYQNKQSEGNKVTQHRNPIV